jgi:hypothetical protein
METDDDLQVSIGLVTPDTPDTPDLTTDFSFYVNDVQIPLTQSATDPQIFTGTIPEDVLANRQTYTVFDFKLPANESSTEMSTNTPPARIAVDFVQLGDPDAPFPCKNR